MASSTKNVKLGVCQLFFDGVDMGYTQGGVEVSVSTDTYKVEIDQFGKTPINEYIQGRQVTVKAPLAETTLRNLVATMPGSTLVTDGVQASATLTFANQPANNAVVTVAGQAFTFTSGTPDAITKVKIGASVGATAQNLVDAINLFAPSIAAAIPTGGIYASLNAAGTVVTLKAGDPGVLGNALALAGVANVAASGAALTGGVAETKARVDVTTGVGIDMLQIAKTLRLHPKSRDANDLSDDFIVHRTATPGALQFAYKVDAERVYNTEFMAYPDPVSNKLFSVGDPQAGL